MSTKPKPTSPEPAPAIPVQPPPPPDPVMNDKATPVEPYRSHRGMTVAFEQPRAETNDVLLFTATGIYVGEKPGRKPGEAESKPPPAAA